MDRNLELSLLRAFVAVVEENNFKRGAQRLATSQSAISVRIKRLEDILGTKIMNRDRQGLSLTPIGKSLLPEAYHLIAEADRVVEKVRAFSEDRPETIKTASTQRAMAAVTPALITKCQKAFPASEFILDALSTAEQLNALQRCEIDLGIIQQPHHSFGDDDDIVITPVEKEPLVIAMAASDPLARKRTLRWASLKNRQITLSPVQRADAAFYDHLIRACQNAGFAPDFDPQEVRFRSLMTYLSTRKSLALVPASTVCPANTTTRPIKDPLFIEFELAWNKRVGNPLLSQIVSLVLTPSKTETPS